jgi:hypothetical protein
MTQMIEIHAQEDVYIREAIAFIGFKVESLEVRSSINDGETLIGFSVRLETFDYNINGAYPVVNQEVSRLSVIMTIGLVRHINGLLALEILDLASRYKHAKKERNSLPEIAIRALITQALSHGVLPQGIMGLLKDKLHIDQNIREQQAFVEIMKRTRKQ